MKRFLAAAIVAASLAPTMALAQQAQPYGAGYAPPAYAAPASSFSYAGPHPNHPSFGGGFCYAQGQHVHPFSVDPNVAYLYRNYAGSYVFVGNVYEFGYQRQAFPYYNHHPLAPEQGGTFCYIDGAHYHYFVPSALYAANHITYNGYYYYNGGYAPSYYSWRNNYYRSYHTYRYLPGYSRYYTNYRTYATTYGRPASAGYMRNPGTYNAARGGYYNNGAANVRVYNTASPAYRYNSARPSTYNTGYARPSFAQSYRPATPGSAPRPTTFQPAPSYRPSTSTSSPARVWRR